MVEVGYLEYLQFSLFGHCWGVLVALEVAFTLKTNFIYHPERLIAATALDPENFFGWVNLGFSISIPYFRKI